MPLFSLFLLEKFFLFKPPGPNKHLAPHTAQPGTLPRILQQTLHPRRGFSRPGPRAGPRDLIVLKHSCYRQIFQCPLSLVSDLPICWNTVGCSLCSSDQLGISLVEGKWTPLPPISPPSSSRFLIPCSLFSPSGIPVIVCSYVFMFQRFLKLSPF